MRWVPPLRPRARLAFLLDLTGALLFGLFSGMVVPFLGVTARRMGASPLLVSLVVAGPAVGLLLTAYWSVAIAGRNPVPYLVWPGVLARSLFLLTSAVTHPVAFVILTLAYHVLNGVTSPAYAAAVQLLFPQEYRGTLLGLARTGLSCASILGSLLAGPFLERFGPGAVFPVAALFGVAGALAYSRIRPPRLLTPPARPSLGEGWRAAWADGQFRWMLVATFAFGVGGWTAAPALPLLLVDVLHAGHTQVGVLAAASNAASVVGFFLWGRTIDRSSGLATLRRALMISPLTPLLYALVPSAWAALVPAAADGFLIAAVELGWMTAVMELAPPHLVVHYTGAYTSLIGVRGLIAPLLAGALLEAVGPRTVLVVAAGWMTTAGVLAWRRLGPR
ncbi:MAG: MFS transporter [Armatimonadota bacterium]|nr:MFS transporter [Armatimonadota bacterium]MDR7439702.1 MFS transporter [Armatimonadota bacterium]MDR7562548.1 MFS transporter [Armatimonadota bacterium]MDR7566882.1 MFS transporter [Armatimonadota bacterium]MDR7603030.1 MFS transporter [Armatimonadota bacterium]